MLWECVDEKKPTLYPLRKCTQKRVPVKLEITANNGMW